MEDKQKLQGQAQVGLALSELRNHHGYKELINILQEMYNSALLELIRHEEEEARIIVKVLQDIVSKIDDSINLGEQAREELKLFKE